MHYAIASLLAFAGILIGIISLAELNRIDSNARFIALLGLLFCLGLILRAVAVLTGSKNRTVSILATLFLVFLWTIELALKCSSGDLPFCHR